VLFWFSGCADRGAVETKSDNYERPFARTGVSETLDSSTDDSNSGVETDDTRKMVVDANQQRGADATSGDTDAYEVVSFEPRTQSDHPPHVAIMNSRKSLSMDNLSTLQRKSSMDSSVTDDAFVSGGVKFSRKVNQSFRAAVDKSYDVPSTSDGKRGHCTCASFGFCARFV
jgi:hypothetical protein